MAKISVIVPVYKVEAYLERCIDSILGQSYQDFDLIMVDDGSPDNCGAICDAYARKCERIHVIHQENGGLSAARNAGLEWSLKNSDSQWVTFIDSDDWVHNEYLKVLISAAKEDEIPIVMCEECVTDVFLPDAQYTDYPVQIFSPEQAYVTNYCASIRACGKLIQKNKLRTIRFPVGRLFEDSFITHLLQFESPYIAICDLGLYYYYISPGSITRMAWSPRKMDEFEGHGIRLQYLQKNGYKEALKQEVKEFFQGGFLQLEMVSQMLDEHPEYREYDAAISAELRKLYYIGRKEGLFPLNFENIRTCIMISPIRWLYPLLQSIKHCASRILGIRSETNEDD